MAVAMNKTSLLDNFGKEISQRLLMTLRLFPNDQIYLPLLGRRHLKTPSEKDKCCLPKFSTFPIPLSFSFKNVINSISVYVSSANTIQHEITLTRLINNILVLLTICHKISSFSPSFFYLFYNHL